MFDIVVSPFTSRGTGRRRVLVSGASFAGLATAFWMNKLGYAVTIVEIANGLRRGGTPVDIKDDMVETIRRMGLLDLVRARSLPPRRTEFKDVRGVDLAVLPARPVIRDAPGEEHEIHRNDLLDIMFAAVESHVEIVFGSTIARFDDRDNGITVWFGDGSHRTFDLVFGCDGLRSNTRRLTFAPDSDSKFFLEKYTFLKVVEKTFIEPNVTQIYSAPGLMVMLNGYADRTDIALAFRSKQQIVFDRRDKEQQRQIVRERFEGLGRRAPEVLAELDAAGEFYFDGLYQVRMPAWSRGRVALVGDAGYCPSPLSGMGGSIAIAGAAALTDAFVRDPDDHVAAYERYERRLRPFVQRVQEDAVQFGATMFTPEIETAIAERDHPLATVPASAFDDAAAFKPDASKP